MKTFEGKDCWGKSISIDLEECCGETIRDGDKLKEFLIEIVKEIDMRAFGDPIVVRFGDNPTVTGYSIAQLIETSLISGHFAEDDNSAYIDIFSCKDFDSDKATDFCKKFFKAKKASYSGTYRGVKDN